MSYNIYFNYILIKNSKKLTLCHGRNLPQNGLYSNVSFNVIINLFNRHIRKNKNTYLFLASLWIIYPGHFSPLVIILILFGVIFTKAFL